MPDLVEFPAVVAGAFGAEFLALPPEVLTTTLIHHQHFFPVVGANGSLMPAFLAVTNTQAANDRAIATNAERVVTARLRDARFFWDADRSVGLEPRLARLETVLFHNALGSYAAKAARIEKLAEWIATDVFKRPAEAGAAARAARLAKADLATDMVREFTELQGTMGGIYAREAGEPEAVWRAIYWHYLPIAVEADAAPSVGGARPGRHRVGLAVACRQTRHRRRIVPGGGAADRIARSRSGCGGPRTASCACSWTPKRSPACACARRSTR